MIRKKKRLPVFVIYFFGNLSNIEILSPLNIIDRKKSESFSVVIIERQFQCTHETERFMRIFMMIQANWLNEVISGPLIIIIMIQWRENLYDDDDGHKKNNNNKNIEKNIIIIMTIKMVIKKKIFFFETNEYRMTEWMNTKIWF